MGLLHKAQKELWVYIDYVFFNITLLLRLLKYLEDKSHLVIL